jgi:uncharacterized protein
MFILLYPIEQDGNDCACAGGIIAQSPRLSEHDDDCACVPGISHHLCSTDCNLSHWQVAPDILCYHLTASKFLLANPNGKGIIALLDQPELCLLSAYDSSRLLDSLNDCGSPFSAEQVKVLTRKWIDLGFLIPAEEDCACVSGNGICNSTQPLLANLTSWFHLTDRCNLHCDYCYLLHVCEDMSPEIGRATVDATFRSAVANGFKQVKFKYAGGEPLLRFPLIVELHRYSQSMAEARDLGLEGVVLSNGTLLTAEMVEMLKSLNLRLMISMDGLGQYHDAHRHYVNGRGSFTDVAESIDLALSNGLIPNVSVTVSSRTVDGLHELMAWILERDLPFSLNFYRENNFSATHEDMRLDEQKIINGMLKAFKVIENNLPRRPFLGGIVDRANLSVGHTHTCGVGQNYLVFDTQGRVSKCQMRMADTVADASTLDPLAVIRADKSGIHNISVEEKEDCRDCQWRYWCAGGCPLETHRATDRYDVKSPNCNIYKALFPEALRLEGLRLLKYQDDPEVVQKIEF